MPISQIAEFSTKLVSPKICRRDHQRCITVKCDTVAGRVGQQRRAADAADGSSACRAQWPPGCRFQFGGEYEEQVKGFDSVGLALVVSLAVIYLALVLQFNSVTKPLVVFVGVPFGMVGGMMGLLPFGTPFGFMAFLGVASLAGVIVSHVIVLVRLHRRGLRARRAAAQGGGRFGPGAAAAGAGHRAGHRRRPDPAWPSKAGPLWEPMCYVQIAGLLLATVVTLGIVPVVYVSFVENLKLIRWEPQEHGVPEEAKSH